MSRHSNFGYGRGLDKQIQSIKEMKLSYDDETEEDNGSSSFKTPTLGGEKVIDTARRDPITGSLLQSEKAKLMQLVDRWEEPDRQSAKLVSQVQIG